MSRRSQALGWLMAGSLVLGTSGAAVAQSASPEAMAGGLADTSWSLTSIGDTPVANSNDGDILFSQTEAGGFADGTVEGFAGCNSFSGGYSVDGDTIAIGPLMSTMMSCDETADAFEGQYLTALQAATAWAIVSGALELRDDEGALQVLANSAVGN